MDDVQISLNNSSLSKAQKVAIGLTAVMGGVDGYDVLATAFAAPGISSGWGIGKGTLGLILSSALAGMAVGSFLIAPLADRYGRRTIVLSTLALMAVGMTMAALSHSAIELATWRLITGLALGALVPINAPLAVEYANAARRRLALGIMTIGFPTGATLGGFAAAVLQHYSNWQSVFLMGSLMSLALLIAAYFWLPETPAFLLSRRPPNALAKLNDYLVRCGHPRVLELPARMSVVADRVPYRTIFSKPNRRGTATVALANLLHMMTVYYLMSWMPQLVADLGHSRSFATSTAAVAAATGIVASVMLGLVGRSVSQRVVAAGGMIGLSASMIAFGMSGHAPAAILMLAALVGVFLYGAVVPLYGVIVDTFESDVRTTGVGFAMGMGRIAGAITPAVAGMLFSIGMERALVSQIMSICSLMAAVIMLASSRLSAPHGATKSREELPRPTATY